MIPYRSEPVNKGVISLYLPLSFDVERNTVGERS